MQQAAPPFTSVANKVTTQRKLLVLGSHLLMLFLFSWFAFHRNTGVLLAGNDGTTGYSLAEEQLSFFGMTTSLHSNPLEGLANISLPYNLTLLPGYWFGSISLLYVWFALQLFVSVLLIGWNYRFPSRVTYFAAWLLTILLFPYFTTFRIYSITASMPNLIGIILSFALMDIGVQRAGLKNWWHSFFYGLVFVAGLLFGLITAPAMLSLIFPLLVVTTMSALLCAPSRIVLARKITILGLVFALSLFCGWIEYLAGIYLYAAGIFFNSEMRASGIDTSSAIYVSILFHHGMDGMTMGPWLFCGGVLGSLYAVWRRTAYQSLAMTILVAQLFIIGGALVGMYFKPDLFSGISPIYFEITLFPFYAIFLVYFVIAIFGAERTHASYITPVMLALLLAGLLMLKPANKNRDGNFAFPPKSTSITDVLEHELALQPGSVFAGRVANIVPDKNWLEQVRFFMSVNNAVGNDHQTTGLWLKHIPTLHEYSQTITPGFYRLYRRFLSDGKDHPYRSWSSFNKLNIKMLQLMGVSYVITTMPAIPNLEQRASLSFKDGLLALHLYHIPQANIAGISARRLVNAADLPHAEEIMDASEFNLQDAVIINQSQSFSHLVPAQQSKMIMGAAGFRLQAKSNGTTLLILPLEFSHCLEVTPHHGEMPIIMRVDASLTGILFNKLVDVSIDSTTGAFHNPRCRLKDYREFAQLWKRVQH